MRKTAVFKCVNRKTEPNIGQIRETENPNAPLIELLKTGSLDNAIREFSLA